MYQHLDISVDIDTCIDIFSIRKYELSALFVQLFK